MNSPGTSKDAAGFSKRAARRLIQRAFVLAGRDKRVHQHLREANLTTLWLLEDWNLSWTVVLERGRLDFERRPAKQPDLVFVWHNAEGFFREVQDSSPEAENFELQGDRQLRRFSEPLLKGFLASLRHVLANPVDDMGESLL